MRVGIGYDSHRFDPGRALILGGVAIPDHAGLKGHSDGDAVAHALIDAILGAAGLGDIGRHYPDSDPRWLGADSMELLSEVVRLVTDRGYRVVNVDTTIIAETPRLSPWVDAIAERIADRLQVARSSVSLKGKTNEGMGWIGRGEGLAVLVVALLDETGDTETPQDTIRSGG